MADMDDMLKNFATMMNGKEIPNNIKEALGSFMNNSGNTGTSNSNVSQDSESQNSSSEAPNIDINTLLKMQKIMGAMNNQKNNSGANLLRSLKPYLKPSRQAKVDEYIGLLSLEKVMELMNNSGGDKNHGA